MIFTKSLKKNRDFKQVYSNGRPAVCPMLMLYTRPNGTDENRVGISVSKKTGNAVTRNRVKRLIRESYRQAEPSVKRGFDIIVRARTNDNACGYKLTDFHKVSESLIYLLVKKDLYNK